MSESTSMKQIADALGVSRATVSNALTGKGRVSAPLVERVRAMAEEMNYIPSHAARSLRLGRSTLIGMVVPDFSMPLFASFAQAFERAARARGLALMVADALNDPQLQRQRMQDFVARGVDGLVVVPMRGALLQLEGLPVALAVVDAEGNPANTASCDHRAGGRLVAGHLADLGHRHVRIVGVTTCSHVSQARVAGMTEGLRARGVEFSVDLIIPGLEGGRAYGLAWNRSATAIAAAYDGCAIGIVNGLLEAGHRVPQDVSVSGFDDVIWGRIITPQLTTVRQDLSAIADHALDVVTRQAEGPRIFPVELVIRGSTAPPSDRRDP
ncbi:LacI family DNA-binding transcriptional regulator [Falsirhodobacter sp. 20TX0035]|uniref:LacI family DNA-binding transcriptional regulator n=1 Tax=Falsirhodobacter sp. 20TX0035 TaxID=3022019 RepID=UPI00232AF008|nr:LacI family DNA-binding transcriptional regulator [Falsirhodobacter sp. 20TX0035]MDB6453534.1 LacI family DNA-binding transcriptional regulator [Falsirhodobacter sp. 20TX0035]